jgi:hypothetical protein
MKTLRHRFLATFVLSAAASTAQTLYIPNGTLGSSSNGNVGVGTSSPSAQLTVRSSVSTSLSLSRSANPNIQFYDDATTYIGQIYYDANRVFHIGTAGAGDTLTLNSADGYVGIGTTSPTEKLTLQGVHNNTRIRLFSDNYGQGIDGANTALLNIWASEPGWTWEGVGIGNNVSPTNGVTRVSTARGGSYIRLLNNQILMSTVDSQGTDRSSLSLNNGNVGIGTTSPTHKLAVNGTIRAKEVIVDTGWSDYVFKPDYKLASLSEVEGAIRRDGHLPGIPSAQEVAEHGVSMGEMQSKLLAKIEELTLHQIAQEKRLNEQNALLNQQATQLSTQSTRLHRLEQENATLRRTR